jgi:hypothetical protein
MAKLASGSKPSSQYSTRDAETLVERGFPAMYRVDNPEELVDNRRNQVNTCVDHAVQQGKTET